MSAVTSAVIPRCPCMTHQTTFNHPPRLSPVQEKPRPGWSPEAASATSDPSGSGRHAEPSDGDARHQSYDNPTLEGDTPRDAARVPHDTPAEPRDIQRGYAPGSPDARRGHSPGSRDFDRGHSPRSRDIDRGYSPGSREMQ